MAKNLIPIIAEKLGVEIGEEFKIREINANRKWRFTENNLQFYDSQFQDDWVAVKPEFIGNLVLGNLEIIKLPYEPKMNEAYYTYADAWEPAGIIWNGNSWDYINKACGIVFRTEKEALATRPAKYKELTGKEWKE